jgi:hypothetical protein
MWIHCWSILSHYKDSRTGGKSKSRSFRSSTGSRVENQLKTIKLRASKFEKEMAAIAFLGINERYSNSFGSNRIESLSARHFRRTGKKVRFITQEISIIYDPIWWVMSRKWHRGYKQSQMECSWHWNAREKQRKRFQETACENQFVINSLLDWSSDRRHPSIDNVDSGFQTCLFRCQTFVLIYLAVPCVVRRSNGGRVVVLRASPSLTGGVEFQDGGGIGHSLKSAEMRHSPPWSYQGRGSPFLPVLNFLLRFAYYGLLELICILLRLSRLNGEQMWVLKSHGERWKARTTSLDCCQNSHVILTHQCPNTLWSYHDLLGRHEWVKQCYCSLR